MRQPAVRGGFGVVGLGAGIDVVYHLWPGAPDLLPALGPAGHLVTLAGMALVMVGVFATGARAHTSQRRVT